MKRSLQTTRFRIATALALFATAAILVTPSIAADQLHGGYVTKNPILKTSKIRPLRVGVPVENNIAYLPAGYFDRCIPLYRWVNRPGFGQFNGLWRRSC